MGYLILKMVLSTNKIQGYIKALTVLDNMCSACALTQNDKNYILSQLTKEAV